MNGLLFDTDVLIDILRNKEATIQQVRSFMEEGSPYCSCITIGEIFAGMRPAEEKPTRELLDALQAIQVDDEIAELAGKLKYKTKSHLLSLDDCIIGASALVHHITLLTKNTKHYPFEKLSMRKIR